MEIEIGNSINFKPRNSDKDAIRLIMAMYPNPTNKTAAIRLALAHYIKTADPVQLEAARKQARKASKEQAK